MPNPSKTFFYSKVYEYIKKFKFISVIDIGCGNCQFYPIFKNNYLGIDFDKKKIKYVKKLYPNCKIIYSNFKNIKISNLFDLVLCLEVNSINDEKKIYSSIKIFKKLMKLSNKNGYIMVNFWKNFIYENVIKIENLIRQNNFKIIKKIEYVLYFNFSQNSERFSNIIINFLNHTTDRYYEICLFHISEKDKFQKQIKYYFENMFADILLIKYLNKKYTEEGDIETLKSSGYNCKENSDCSSNHCVNNVCYIDEKEVNIDDIRSIGNPCLYNIQCRSGDCRDYVCIGEDNHEKEKNYDQVYDEDEIIEYEDNIEMASNSQTNTTKHREPNPEKIKIHILIL